MAPNRYQNRIELLQGTLDLLILQTLRWGAQHGYGISQAIKLNSGDILQVDTGSLYPALHRLQLRGLLSAKWGSSENNRRAKFYQLTAEGRKVLSACDEGVTAMEALVRRMESVLVAAALDPSAPVSAGSLSPKAASVEY